MNIRYITCSDLREDVPFDKAVELLQISDRVELGIQVHSSAMRVGMPRNLWLNGLLAISADMPKPLNIAIHVNYDWCSDFCQGKIAPELLAWFDMMHKGTGEPIIKRWQLNIGDGTRGFDVRNTANIISDSSGREFIFPFNNQKDTETDSISKLDAAGVDFSLLFDASYGAGISPDNWSPPVYKNKPQGYAGGLWGGNIEQNLNIISKVIPENYEFWIDAEGKLMTPGTRRFDIERGRDYIIKAIKWLERQK
jgi:hypothetical protein